jgi:hypothetical protein
LGNIFYYNLLGVVAMKKARILLAICLAFPLSVFAVGTTDVAIGSGVESIVAPMPC